MRLTLWRLVNSCILLGFGIAKAILAYHGNSAVNTLDMALGLIWAFISYWCGLIETDCPTVLPWLFLDDILPLLIVPFYAVAVGILVAVQLALSFTSVTHILSQKESSIPEVAALTVACTLGSCVVSIVAGVVGLHAQRAARQIPVSHLFKPLSYKDWNPKEIMVDQSLLKIIFFVWLPSEVTFLTLAWFALPVNYDSDFILVSLAATSLTMSMIITYVLVGLSRMAFRLRSLRRSS